MPSTSSDANPRIKPGKADRNPPSAGDTFQVQLEDGRKILGCVVRDDAVVGPFTGALVVYLFKPDCQTLPHRIDPGSLPPSLLLAPMLTNPTPWEKGLFRATGRMPDGVIAEGIRHTYRNRLNQRCFDDFGNPVQAADGWVGDWSLKLHGGVRAAIEAALAGAGD